MPVLSLMRMIQSERKALKQPDGLLRPALSIILADTARGLRYKLCVSNTDKLAESTAWRQKNITGDEKGQAQIFLDRLFQAFGQSGCLDVGGTAEFRVRKSHEDGGGTAFADFVWKPVVLVEMKKRGENLQKPYRQAFDYWTRLVPNRPRYVVLCNFDEFRVYDFDTDLDAPKDTVALKDLPERSMTKCLKPAERP